MKDTDVTHSFNAEQDWNESFYFSFYDRNADINAFMRIGLKPNRSEKSRFCFFMLPDGTLAGIKDAAPYDGPSLEVKGLKFEKLTAEKLWRLSYVGKLIKFAGKSMTPVDISFEAEFESLNPMFDYRECVSGIKEQISQRVASEHLEQFGRAKGTLTVEGKEYAIDGLGERDHSWGVRDWNAPKMWIWLTCQFDEKCALNVTKLTVDEGVVDAGFVHVDSKNRPLMAADIDTVYEPDGSPKSFTMKLTDKDGKVYRVNATIVKKAALPFPSPDGKIMSVMHETLAKYEMDGKEGYGIAEYLIKVNK